MPPKRPKNAAKANKSPIVSLAMGSQSDWETMQSAAEVLTGFRVPFETLIVSAHRTPQRLFSFALSAAPRGIRVIIAGAGGAAHLPGMIASLTTLPVFGVPVVSKSLDGLDSLLSISQMPAGVPVGTLAIGNAGATNAGLLAVSVLALQDPELADRLRSWRSAQTASIAATPRKTKRVGK
ncbi:MAG: 5-(carboxyamino)imidazole ribonucleotide mutase [Pseudomonadota bacterium]|nr:5-(carboxyamino)imidazole ribonucleotide mutase [Pseudomonadota bacterium]